MPNIKYICPKCGRKFVEWGAKKLDFKCPHCQDTELQRMGIRSDQIIATPKARRRPRLVEEESEKEIEFPEEYLQEEYEEDFGLAQVNIDEEEEISVEEDLHSIEEIPEDTFEDGVLPPEDETDMEEE
ncbi:MAG: hypothetical protein N3G21_10080 [Candidatus Hydrogenedentes bacterium]|nr:hypothetical protein [Candidatus Hydrogenedentota bacterium]